MERTTEQKIKHKEYMKEYCKQSKFINYCKEYNQRSEVKERKRLYKKSVKYLEWKKEYNERPEVKLKAAAWMRNKRQRLKELIYLKYGGYKCALCNESRSECLSIDHINGGGSQHRKEIGQGANLYYWIIKNNFPQEFRILCMNCNHSLGRTTHKRFFEEKQNVNTM